MEKEYNVTEVAEILCVAEETVRRWLRSGKLNGVRKMGPGGCRIRESDITDFLRRVDDPMAKRYQHYSILLNKNPSEDYKPEVIENSEPDINARISELEINVKLLTAELNYLKAIRDIMEGV